MTWYSRSALFVFGTGVFGFGTNILSAQTTFVFLGSYNSNNWDSSKAGIYVYQLDTATGRLTSITSVVTNVTSQTVTVLKRDLQTGSLTKVNQESIPTNVSCVQVKQY